MRVRHLRMLIFMALMIVIGGWGLGLLPAPGQDQQQDPCPQAGCPEKPKGDPPQGLRWVLVIVHVGEGKVTPPCDPDKKPVAEAEVTFQDPQTKNRLAPGSQQPQNGLTDAIGRYAAYLALPAADWQHVEVQVKKFGFKLAGVTGKAQLKGILTETALKAIACLESDPNNPGQLELQLWPRPGVPDQSVQPLIGQQKTTVGSWMCVNLDNDDRDDQFDLNDTNVAVGPGGSGKNEDDLVQLVIPGLAGAPAGAQVKLQANKGANKIKLWDSPTKGNQVNLPVQYAMNNLPQTLWIEGIAGSIEPRDVELELAPAGGWGAKAPKGDKVTLTVIAVKMEWVPQGNNLSGKATFDKNPNNPNTDLNRHPSGTFGLRVFPEAPAPGQPARDKVTLQVTLSAPVPSEFKLYLRSLDVDDPSSQSAELDPNDTATTAGTYPNTSIGYTPHEDNRGSAGVKSGRFVARASDVEVPQNALTDPQGVQYFPATVVFKANDKSKDVDFQVTKQPGDNFRVLASCDPDFLNDAVNQDNQQHGLDIRIATAQAGAAPLALLPQHSSWQSEVLTVWRRLHVERDSMHNPNQGGIRRNTVTGTIINVQPIPPPPVLPNRCEATVTQLQRGGVALADLEDVDQYAPGELTVAGLSYKTVTPDPDAKPPIHANTLDTVTVASLATLCPQAKEQFTLHDDDVDINLPRLPDLDWMQDSDDKDKNLFAMAYIRPVDDGGGGKTGEQDFPFDVNTEDDEANDIKYYSKRQSVTPANNPNDYWMVYILSAFQGPFELSDGDPDSENKYVGLSPFFLASDNNVALIYVEGYRDACGGLDQGPGRSGLQATVIHEVGHAFGGIENEGGVMNQGCLKPQSFVDITLNSIRSTQRPGGGTLEDKGGLQ